MSAKSQRTYQAVQLAARSLRTAADAALATVGATMAQATAMAVIHQHDHATQREISAALGVNESAVTATLSRMERQGFVERHTSKGDRRVRHVSLTEAGTRAGREAEDAFSDVNARIDAALTSAEVEQLGELLERLTLAVGNRPRRDPGSAR